MTPEAVLLHRYPLGQVLHVDGRTRSRFEMTGVSAGRQSIKS